ncbi:MAG: HAD family hydrolase [Isosphaeraceae bacterium]|nr:HAD family hydrolase [Isosphaeraceae bacterium]
MTPLRIAMWSGPRNISTALMRSWGNRPDTFVSDEPLYAHYLAATGIDHPGADEVVAHHEPNWQKAVAGLIGEIPDGKSIYYQKHMAHHLLPDIGREWLGHLTHAFLIRDPREMLLSLAKVLPNPGPEATGLPQQVEIFEWARAHGRAVPPVVDARDILENPRALLTRLCQTLGVDFRDEMLSWSPGRRATDGIWAKHWYENVEKSTSFQPYRAREEALPEHLRPVLAECQPYYDLLHGRRLRPDPS